MNENELYKSIGNRIASVRKKHKMTQETLANKLGVTTKHISHVENGTSSLSLKTFIQFCEEFSCSLDYLVLGRDFSSDFLPESIIKIINSGTADDRDRLLRYLEIFSELSSTPLHLIKIRRNLEFMFLLFFLGVFHSSLFLSLNL